ncbi:uncharacterized protein HMPREF1541_08898 [Cyphellophora europaea CBS 101466]|uniref:Uncharacterized protein n=1 Tax=Cyphellophora europaea (strain CBS 101466) TaxID=1220924 RepID=W2RJU7_CYPE1|nr:uncharacterized protein HMPREF1541_08898 [Cyphellophora europaea CBS 101466]ETN36620.1 hypothetical protein HMPREF1541_08898 [Cyphellophora europaea CBS 101466]
MASKPQESSKQMMLNKNVAGGQLARFSMQPPTGFYRDGYCRVGPEDKGNHSVAAVVTEDFLNYSASQGNNLKEVGVKPGMKWCLCAHRWKDAFDAAQKGLLSNDAVPKVSLHATHEAALEKISYKELKQYASVSEADAQSNRQPSHQNPGTSSIAKETTSIQGNRQSTAN